MSELPALARAEGLVSSDSWDSEYVFCDWLTLRQPNDGSYPALESGRMIRLLPGGVVDYDIPLAVKVEGSFDSSARVRVTPDFLELSFNPSRWDRSDNLFGFSFSACLDIADSLLASVDIPPLNRQVSDVRLDPVSGSGFECSLGCVVTRIDLTLNIRTGSVSNLVTFLRKVSFVSLRHLAMSRYSGSVVFRGKSKSVSIYSKGAEMRKHGTLCDERERVADFCDEHGCARVELRLKREFLRRHGLRFVGCLTDTKLKEVFMSELAELPRAIHEVDVSELTYLELGVLTMWHSGHDVRSLVPIATFYRRRRRILDVTGFDISSEGPIRLETKEAVFKTTALRPPSWYKLAVPKA